MAISCVRKQSLHGGGEAAGTSALGPEPLRSRGEAAGAGLRPMASSGTGRTRGRRRNQVRDGIGAGGGQRGAALEEAVLGGAWLGFEARGSARGETGEGWVCGETGEGRAAVMGDAMGCGGGGSGRCGCFSRSGTVSKLACGDVLQLEHCRWARQFESTGNLQPSFFYIPSVPIKLLF